jgi:8-oxo-dGTP pyrophosphatase MutT (NUDIX family)
MKLPVWKPLYRTLKALGVSAEWEISVGAAVYREADDGRRMYLLLQYLSGHFDFPKGHIEEGETEEMTLRRETEEETGIADLTVLPYRSSIRYFYRAHGSEAERRRREHRGTFVFKEVHFYPARTVTESITLSHEHRGFVWLPYAEALEKVTFDNAKRILRESEVYLKGVKA